MKCIVKDGHTYILRFDRGEEVIGAITKFCDMEKIDSGFLTGIGATEDVVLAHYDIDKKEYKEKEVKERMEITGLLGNITRTKDKIFVHIHGSFSDNRMRMTGGHVKKLVVSATCEVTLRVLKQIINRKFDEKTGLNVME